MRDLSLFFPDISPLSVLSPSHYKASQDTAQHIVVVKTNELSFLSTPNDFTINSSHSSELWES